MKFQGKDSVKHEYKKHVAWKPVNIQTVVSIIAMPMAFMLTQFKQESKPDQTTMTLSSQQALNNKRCGGYIKDLDCFRVQNTSCVCCVPRRGARTSVKPLGGFLSLLQNIFDVEMNQSEFN